MKAAIRVLVLGVGGNVSQGILKALYRSNLSLEVMGADVSPDQAGLFMVRKAFVGPWANASDFKSWLIDLCQREGIQVVLSGTEPVVKALAEIRKELHEQSGALSVVSTKEVIEIGDDKLRTCEWLAANNFPHPSYARSEDLPGVSALLDACGFPLIAKPRRGGGARGVFIVDDEAALAYAVTRKNYLIQEYIGCDEHEYTAGCFIDRAGEMRGSMVMRRDLNAGTTYRAELGEYPQVRAMAERIAVALGPEGPCNVQLRLASQGPVCFEINPRFSGTTPIRARFGYNEAEASLRHFLLNEDPAPLVDPKQGWALRYWEELYPAMNTLDQLRGTGQFEAKLLNLPVNGWVAPK